ncbi:MAG TPA: RnfABCDGE type electron transport complex subunit D [Clostridia bacterium]|nr:RnfABCDGE type electron transport complex subunit D [Clostridia bacterium]
MIVTCSPHIRHHDTTKSIMRDVLIALLPALMVSVVVFGIRALLLVAVCVFFAVGAEYVFEKGCRRPITIGDYSAAVTGVLLAYNLPVGLPLWMAAFGSIVAVIVVKQLFGGIGQNFANPAITARIVLLISFTGPMTDWVTGYPDAVAGATPLTLMATGQTDKLPSIAKMALGEIGGCIGEVSAVALLLGFVYLLYRKVITWHITVSFIATVAVLTALLGQSPVYHMLAGGLMLGAIFMATDYSTSPPTPKGRIIFGVGCGLLTVLIRVFGSYPEGVSFAILLMNIMAPHISNLTRNKALGGAAK